MGMMTRGVFHLLQWFKDRRKLLTIYYQHIGEVMWERDGPRSIGTPKTGVVRFFSRY